MNKTKTNFITTMYIPKEKIMKYNDLIRNDYNDLIKLGVGEFAIIEMFTAKFEDGYEARLYIKSHDFESGEVTADMVLFDENNQEVDYQTTFEEIDGTWYIYDRDMTYTIMVIGE